VNQQLLTHIESGGRRGRDRMVVGFTTTYAIGAYHHWCCEFESRSGRGVQHYVMKFVSDLLQVGGFLRVLRFPPPIKLNATYNWNIVESGICDNWAYVYTCKKVILQDPIIEEQENSSVHNVVLVHNSSEELMYPLFSSYCF